MQLRSDKKANANTVLGAKNKFSGLYERASSVLAAKKPNSNEYFVGANGEINAGSAAELSKSLLSLANSIQSGDILPLSLDPDHSKKRRERFNVLTAAYTDRNSSDFLELGQALGASVYESATREGFVRTILTKLDIETGQEPYIDIDRNDAGPAFVATDGLANHEPHIVRNKRIRPTEFYLRHNLFIEELELQRGASDLLDRAYYRALEQIMVKEDKIWLNLVNSGINTPTVNSNELQYFVGSYSPNVLGSLQHSISRWGLQPILMLAANDILPDIMVSAAFSTWFDPVSKYEIVMTGTLGSILGMSIRTDAYREPQLKVLSAGDVYLLSEPKSHGSYTDRGPLVVNEVTNPPDGKIGRGWSMYEILSMTVHNMKSVVKGQRR